jgi:rfaE bifunctional protein nucleotidyltransferase chain/domain
MNKAIFLDRDGTLNYDKKGYIHKVEELEFYPDVFESLNSLKHDYSFIIITNQSGIGRGYYTEAQFHEFNDKLVEKLSDKGIKIEKTYFCPHHPEEECICRKPNLKFIRQAQKEFNINLEQSWVIGDHPHDVELGKKAGCKAIYLLTGHGVKHRKEMKIKPDYIAGNLKQAKDFILFDKDSKIVSRQDLGNLAEDLRKKRKKIVTLNGTFDILHKGHEKIIDEAKKQGDVLFVGVNSDRSVKKNKGQDRPLNDENSRAKMMANFDSVDYVFIFDEDTPIKFIEEIRPDVHVNGSEYGDECIEAETVIKYGGIIHVVRLLEGYSTTNMIN